MKFAEFYDNIQGWSSSPVGLRLTMCTSLLGPLLPRAISPQFFSLVPLYENALMILIYFCENCIVLTLPLIKCPLTSIMYISKLKIFLFDFLLVSPRS